MNFIKRKLRKIFGTIDFTKGSLNGAGHRFRIWTSRHCYVYPQVNGRYGSYYDHPFPEAEHIDWSKEGYRIQPCDQIIVFWLWFRLSIKIFHHYEWQSNQDAAMRRKRKELQRNIEKQEFNDFLAN